MKLSRVHCRLPPVGAAKCFDDLAEPWHSGAAMKDFEVVTAADVQLIQGLAQRVTATAWTW